jgi:hypothetical protein
MSARIPPARPRLDHPQVERIAYLKLIKGEITVDQYRQAIAPASPSVQNRRRWRRGA